MDDAVLEKPNDTEQTNFIDKFFKLLEKGDLEEAQNSLEYCNWILQVQALFSHLLISKKKVRFQEIVKSFLQATIEETEVLKSKRTDRVERFLKVRYQTSLVEFYQFLAELFSGIDLTEGKYGEEPLFR